jgi:predicted dehydrogenase
LKDLVRLGFLGVAHFHADSYAQAAKKLSNIEVAGVYDRSPDLASQFAERFGLRRYRGPEKLLKDVDAVVIASENVLHYEYVLKAADMDKHILCEKPMAVSLEQADEIVRTVEKTGIKFQMCYVMRYHTV